MSAVRQLALPFAHDPRYAAADFLAAPSNAEALAWLERSGTWPGGRLCVWGAEGSGKTHLLHLWAERSGAELRSGPALRGLPAVPCAGVAIDDADAAPEQPLLHWLNACAEAGCPVLLAGRAPPARWRVGLPDLASRLRATTAVEIRPADDALLAGLLERLLSDRQLSLAEPVREWLTPRLPRSAGGLREVVARLDRAALAAGGRITRPIAAAVLAGMEAADDVSAPSGAELSPGAPRLI
jgi:chromosomal replication initiation ATPase DnaA